MNRGIHGRDQKTATDRYKKAKALCEQHGDLELLVGACTGQARTLEKARRFEEAMRLVNQHGPGALRARRSEVATIDFLIRVHRMMGSH